MDNKYLQDISDIKNLMNKSSQFLSLSGLGGIMAGVYALVGAFIANEIIAESTTDRLHPYILPQSSIFVMLAAIAVIVLVLSVSTALLLTYNKTKKDGETIWNSTSKRLLINFLIPLITGGIFILIQLQKGNFSLIAPATLLFYGLSCVNASKYTFRDVRYLGISITVIGLIASEFTSFALELWAVGFGLCHIVYGSMMYFKYEHKKSI